MSLYPRALPDIASLRRRAQSLAMLDAIVSPAWEDRYYSFDARWSDTEAMASMRNGSGDDWFILFGPFGAAIKGLTRESALAGDAVLANEVQRQVPPSFASFLGEAAFSMDWLSYCYWRAPDDLHWHKVVHPDAALARADDGSTEFLSLLIEPPASYRHFASWYYERELPMAAIERVYEHRPLTDDLVRALNDAMDLAEAREAAAAIGYPSTGAAT